MHVGETRWPGMNHVAVWWVGVVLGEGLPEKHPSMEIRAGKVFMYLFVSIK